ncbi:hypothetical protein Bpfe_001613, partial [Biomphalaria pfeifferi]
CSRESRTLSAANGTSSQEVKSKTSPGNAHVWASSTATSALRLLGSRNLD